MPTAIAPPLPDLRQPVSLDRAPAEHLAELVPVITEKFNLSPRMSPEEVLSALRGIAKYADQRSRWLAAFASPIGRVIAGRGVDLNTALASIVNQLPPAKAH